MLEKGNGIDNIAVGAGIGVVECAKWKPHWKIEKYNPQGELYASEEFDGNMLLNEGITEMLNLLIGGTATPFNNANARIGVGDNTTPAANSQTGLQATTNKAYSLMDATYPQVSGQTVTFRATFGSGVAAFAWNEFTIVNAADDSGKNLCRKVEAHGSKASTDTWVIQVQITIS